MNKVDARRIQIISGVFLVMLTSDISLKVLFYTYRDKDINLGDILEGFKNILLLFSSTEYVFAGHTQTCVFTLGRHNKKKMNHHTS